MSHFLAAAIQLRTSRSINENISTASRLIREAAKKGASYIQTPEMTHLLERNRKSLMEKVQSQEDDLGVAAFSSLAKDLNVTLHIGSLAVLRADGKLANRAFVFAPDGTTLKTYDKIHMFDVDLESGESWRESNTYEPGTCSAIAESPVGPIGMGICYDVRFPALFRNQASQGAKILTAPACFTRQTGEAHWHILVRARAIENASFMVAAAQGGTHEDGRVSYGHSMIVDPWGTVLAEADHDEPGIITATIDLSAADQARSRIPVLTHERDFARSNT